MKELWITREGEEANIGNRRVIKRLEESRGKVEVKEVIELSNRLTNICKSLVLCSGIYKCHYSSRELNQVAN